MEPLLQGFMWMRLMRCHACSAACMAPFGNRHLARPVPDLVIVVIRWAA
jgi:hypothetical protein